MSEDHEPLKLEDVVAIDVHVHATKSAWRDKENGTYKDEPEPEEGSKRGRRLYPLEIAPYYRSRKMMAVVFPLDNSSGMGTDPVPNDEVVEAAQLNPDVMIPFASIDPWKGEKGLAELRRLIDGGVIRGLKFHPGTQDFSPNDPRHYRLFAMMEEAGLVALFHTGQTAVGQGKVRLKHGNPMLLDDLAVDFPELNIIMAHPSVPWQDEALSIAGHKPNIHIDLSGWLPKYIPESLISSANRLLKKKVLFGTDYPMLTPEVWLESFETRDIRPDVLPLILKENAVRLFGL